MRDVVRVGTRGSALALWQTTWVVEHLRVLHPHAHFEVIEIRTTGDRVRDRPLFQAGGVGLFVKELEVALLAAEIDLAVHSLKDMPGRVTPGLDIAAMPEREDPRDALVSRLGLTLDALPEGARVGTSSRRRAAQLLAQRPDLEILDIRGNIDTRLRKAAEEPYDAVILAVAGLVRLGLAGRITQVLPPEVMLPAVGQGALAVEIRDDDASTRALVLPLDHPVTRSAVTAERAFMVRLGGGCHVPIGAYAIVDEGGLWLRGFVASPDGQTVIHGDRRGPVDKPESLGSALAEELLAGGALNLLELEGEVN
ncbi:MAG: hydroxymethylbilane synthase [Anaerolineae bacterium]|nr:hydroxymethylbilane synthase [Anaerolineae bacterium]